MTMARLLAVTGLLWSLASATANEIGFEEDFALSANREEVLKQLIPGTQEYYFYHCLNAQNQGRRDAFDGLMQKWIERYGENSSNEELRNRQALLDYDKTPDLTLAYLKQKLNLTFRHQKADLGRAPNLPTALDRGLLATDALVKRAMQMHLDTSGFNDNALPLLATRELTLERRRALLGRVDTPDFPDLVKLIAEDLDSEHSGGFGSAGIHAQLTRAQLDELAAKKPDLAGQNAFVMAYIQKLRPGSDVDWTVDPKAKQAYLEAMEAYVTKLAPAFNSLKAHVLFQRLRFDLTRGVFDKPRFMAYLKLPRPAPYMVPEYLQKENQRLNPVDLTATFPCTALPPITDDQALVRAFFLHFFQTEATYAPYAEFVRDDYLKRLFAETKIVNGIGDMEKWYSMFDDPTAYQALKDRVELDFVPTNSEHFKADDPVKLDLDIKNVPKLIVKVFEINTFNYYRDHHGEVQSDLNLDGLVASEETTHEYTEPPLRRMRRSFEFPNLNRPGTYVIEFIGNGRSSRALIRKGHLRCLEQTTAAGHEFEVVDESGKLLKDAALWLQGRRFAAGDEGRILVPFSTAPGRQSIILQQGSRCGLWTFEHKAETYALSASFFVDREALLRGRQAQVVVRPTLYICGQAASPALLSDASLTVWSENRDGVRQNLVTRGLKLSADAEYVQAFRVPPDLRQIGFQLEAKIRRISDKEEVPLASSASFPINGIDATDLTEDLHLARFEGGYVLMLLGKNGEPRPDRPVDVTLRLLRFRDDIHSSLKTDAKGRIDLGPLGEVRNLSAKAPNANPKEWSLATDWHSQPYTLNGKEGEILRVPFMGATAPLSREAVALHELRGGTYTRDCFEALSLKEGYLEMKGLSAGSYRLKLKETGQVIQVEVAAGERVSGHVISPKRILEILQANPLQIESVSADAENLTVQLRNFGPHSRVHITATKFMPDRLSYDQWKRVRPPESEVLETSGEPSLYLSGRDIGDEYRYILERKYAKKFPGNMLDRPGLLLNPWALADTTASELGTKGAGAYGAEGGGGRARGTRHGGGGKAVEGTDGVLPNLDFLATPSPLWTNLKPDEHGVVRIPRKALGDKTHIHVVAVDPLTTAYRQVALPESDAGLVDLRLTNALDPAKHFSEQKRTDVLAPGGVLTLADTATTQAAIYDTVAKVYGLYTSIGGNSKLEEFAFVTEWPKRSAEEKRTLYSKYACHELSFFLFHKDPEFFKTVIKPYLANKRDKTFLDHWLLEDDLAPFAEPRAFARLNLVERILLGRRLEAERAGVNRNVKELVDLVPPNPEGFNYLFDTAVSGSALEEEDTLGLHKAQAQAAVPPAPAPEAVEGGERLAEVREAAAEAPAKKAAGKKGDEENLKDHVEEADDRAWDEKDAEKARKEVQDLYVALRSTQEWAEDNYYHLPIAEQNDALIAPNAFWTAFADHKGEGGFRSELFPLASGNFTEMLFALAVLDLPFEAVAPERKVEGPRLTLTVKSPAVVLQKGIQESAPAAEAPPLLVVQNYFDATDRYGFDGGRRFDKYVSEEFLAHHAYGCQVVLTNPTSQARKIDVLLQIPRGALPLSNGFYTRGQYLELNAYGTTTLEYYFYFPDAGSYPHFPVHVAREGKHLAAVPPKALKVVEKPTTVDAQSWAYLSQHGSTEQVLARLQTENLHRLDLASIAWRMKDRAVYDQVLALLRKQHAYDDTLWSYSVFHNDLAGMRIYLGFADAFLDRCGPYLQCKIADLDPVERGAYQQLEYSPLVNDRAHRMGRRPRIADRKFFEQYGRLMHILCYRPKLDDRDRMAVAYVLLLQDRVPEALDVLGQVDPAKLNTRLQYDYMRAYADFYTMATQEARSLAEAHKDHPVDRWRSAFRNILNQLDEAEGKAAQVADNTNRDQRHAQQAAQAPSFDFTVADKKVTIHYQNLDRCQVNYYLMDLELLFSNNPFVQEVKDRFAYVKPNMTAAVDLPPGEKSLVFDLPKEFHNANVMVELVAGDSRKAQAYYAHSLQVQVIEAFGQVKITTRENGQPLPKVYVKVYAKRKNQSVAFYKDGYTDLRGRFDYSSVSNKNLDGIERFALLIMSEDRGAMIQEASAPAR